LRGVAEPGPRHYRGAVVPGGVVVPALEAGDLADGVMGDADVEAIGAALGDPEPFLEGSACRVQVVAHERHVAGGLQELAQDRIVPEVPADRGALFELGRYRGHVADEPRARAGVAGRVRADE